MHPLPESARLVLNPKQDRASTMDQHAAQVHVAPLTHAEQLLLASGGKLPGHDAHPGGKVTAPSEGAAVSDRSHGSSRNQWAEAGNLTELPAASVLITN